MPSLPALRAFEAAARHASLSAAARSLNVTHAAIAQHVRALEDHFGCALMHRDGKGMALTDQGLRLAGALTEGFTTIAEAVEELQRRDAQRGLRIATTPSFAENWLMPRIGSFWSEHPDIVLELVPSVQSVDLRRDGFDVALRYGRGDWSGLDSEMLVSGTQTVVAAPGHIPGDRIDALSDLTHARWIQIGLRREDNLWLQDHGFDVDAMEIAYLDTGALVLQAVRAGNGVSVQPRPIVENDLSLGSLVALYKDVTTDLAYHIVTRPGRVSDQLRVFLSWLRKQAA